MTDTQESEAVAHFRNWRDYIAYSGRHKTTVAAMDWALAEIATLTRQLAEAQVKASILDEIGEQLETKGYVHYANAAAILGLVNDLESAERKLAEVVANCGKDTMMTDTQESEAFVRAEIVEGEWEKGYKAAQDQWRNACALAAENAIRQEEQIATLTRQLAEAREEILHLRGIINSARSRCTNDDGDCVLDAVKAAESKASFTAALGTTSDECA